MNTLTMIHNAKKLAIDFALFCAFVLVIGALTASLMYAVWGPSGLVTP